MQSTLDPDWDTGCVHVYTGNGKGKTTAAFGLALRAVGAGLNVFIGQFVKGMHYSELNAIRRFSDCIDLVQFGRGCFIHREPAPEDREAAKRGLAEVRQVFSAGRHRVVILDEANIATHFGLFSVEDLLALIDAKPPHIELVITGRRADPRVIEKADLVTEMCEVKHYYARGITARQGIEN